jgi:hypothetical protein
MEKPMSKRQANMFVALIAALIVTHILCTALILIDQGRTRRELNSIQSGFLRSAAPAVRDSAAAPDEEALRAAQTEVAEAERMVAAQTQTDLLQLKIAEMKAKIQDANMRLEAYQSKAEAELLEAKLLRERLEAQATSINRELAEQNTRLSSTILIPLAK